MPQGYLCSFVPPPTNSDVIILSVIMVGFSLCIRKTQHILCTTFQQFTFIYNYNSRIAHHLYISHQNRPNDIFFTIRIYMYHQKIYKVGTSQKVILMGFFVFFSCFFQDLREFVRHCNKIHIFLCLFVLFVHY